MDDDNFDAAALNAGLNGLEVEDTADEVQDHENDDTEIENDDVSDDQDDEDEHVEVAPVAQTSKTKEQSRQQKLANERNKERAEKQAEREQRLLAEQKNQILEQQLAEFRKGQQKVEDENLDPMEKWQRDANAAIQRATFESRDNLDESKFIAKISKNPALAQYQDAVEKRLAEARKHGFNPDRTQVLEKILGEKAISDLSKVPEIKRKAAEKVEKAAGKPLGSKSNVAPSKATESTEYDRLKGMTL